MLKIKIFRKKQFPSYLVPFYIVLNMTKEEFAKAINKGEDICAYPIKSGEEIILNIPNSSTTLFAINSNFRNTKIYPFKISNELQVDQDIVLQLEQTKFFKTVEIKISQIEDKSINIKKVKEYNL